VTVTSILKVGNPRPVLVNLKAGPQKHFRGWERQVTVMQISVAMFWLDTELKTKFIGTYFTQDMSDWPSCKKSNELYQLICYVILYIYIYIYIYTHISVMNLRVRGQLAVLKNWYYLCLAGAFRYIMSGEFKIEVGFSRALWI
jgi:hypothetical protein